jgi:thymidylate synthase (FAD)
MFVARQLQKHEYMPWNEISRRYTTENIEFYEPKVWRGKSEDKKQGSDGVVNIQLDQEVQWHRQFQTYQTLIDEGVSPEMARMVLPQSMYTEWFWSGTVGAVAKMANLRCKPDTQEETRIIADQISEKMRELFPVSWAALTEDDNG